MPLLIRNDPNRPSGGYAILEGPGLAAVAAVSVENIYTGLFLAEGGRWTKLPHDFAVEIVPGTHPAVRLGPAIVDHVPEELQLALRTGDGRDLGHLIWLGITPSRGRAAAAPPSKLVPPGPPAEAPAPPVPCAAPPVEPSAPRQPSFVQPPPARRSVLRPVVATVVLLACAVAGVSWWLGWGGARSAPTADAGRCAESFGSRIVAAREGSDDERVRVAEDALAARCGAQAFTALDGTDWEVNEAAAWHLARFYDPNETNPTVRMAQTPHPDWAATYYVHWASRIPREAAALKQLCATDTTTLDANTQLKRACNH